MNLIKSGRRIPKYEGSFLGLKKDSTLLLECVEAVSDVEVGALGVLLSVVDCVDVVTAVSLLLPDIWGTSDVATPSEASLLSVLLFTVSEYPISPRLTGNGPA